MFDFVARLFWRVYVILFLRVWVMLLKGFVVFFSGGVIFCLKGLSGIFLFFCFAFQVKNGIN